MIVFGCKTENHIDKYKANLDSLLTLPDGFYAYRHGRIYFSDNKNGNYIIWYNLNFWGNISTVFKIDYYEESNNKAVSKFKVDTIESKKVMQHFIELSSNFKFGHISIDRKNKVSFSYQDGLQEQYVKPLNDSIKTIYLKKKDFKLLKNDWFEFIEK